MCLFEERKTTLFLDFLWYKGGGPFLTQEKMLGGNGTSLSLERAQQRTHYPIGSTYLITLGLLS